MFSYKKVLVILPARLGDTLFCTPCLRLLHQEAPQTQIDVLALTPLAASILDNNPAVKNIFVAPDKQQLPTLCASYDLVLALHNDAATQEYIKQMPIKTIVMPVPREGKHQTQQKLEFMQTILDCEINFNENKYCLYPKLQHTEQVASLLRQQKFQAEQDILVGCHLGCHGIAKRGLKFWKRLEHRKAWPVENFIDLAKQLHAANPRIRLVLTGSKSEKKLGKQLMRAMPGSINLIDKTSVLELAALMKFLKVYVTADTGPLHVACASHVDLVALYALNVPGHVYPYPMQENYTVLEGTTMAEIPVTKVCEAVLRNIAGLLCP